LYNYKKTRKIYLCNLHLMPPQKMPEPAP